MYESYIYMYIYLARTDAGDGLVGARALCVQQSPGKMEMFIREDDEKTTTTSMMMMMKQRKKKRKKTNKPKKKNYQQRHVRLSIVCRDIVVYPGNNICCLLLASVLGCIFF